MTEKTKVKVLEEVVVRFSGDSGDGISFPMFRPVSVMKFLHSPIIRQRYVLRKER